MATRNLDLMSDDLFDIAYSLTMRNVLNLRETAMTSLDTSDAQTAMRVASNMLEYLDYQSLQHNVTGSWNSTINFIVIANHTNDTHTNFTYQLLCADKKVNGLVKNVTLALSEYSNSSLLKNLTVKLKPIISEIQAQMY